MPTIFLSPSTQEYNPYVTGAGSEGQNRGIIAFYYPGSVSGQRAAELFASALREIYPLPDRVTTRSAANLTELRRTKAPAVLLELGYHDNAADAMWVQEHIGLIAQTLVQALTEYFGLPYVCPGPSQTGLAVTDSGGPVNLRRYPSVQGQVIVQIPNGSTVTVFGRYRGWYVVLYGDALGYANSAFIQL